MLPVPDARCERWCQGKLARCSGDPSPGTDVVVVVVSLTVVQELDLTVVVGGGPGDSDPVLALLEGVGDGLGDLLLPWGAAVC